VKKPRAAHTHTVVTAANYALFVRSLWTEKQFLAEVIQVAKGFGWTVYHTHDSRRSEEGFPDLAMRRDETYTLRALVAELKVGDNMPTKAQRAWLEAFAAAGVPAFLWRPGDWEVIVKVLGSR
jgi:hypothetical protein